MGHNWQIKTKQKKRAKIQIRYFCWSGFNRCLHRSWLHWMLCNVKGFQLESGRVLCNYQPPTPSANSGIHRYVIFLFKQQDHLDQVAAYEDARRGKFSVTDFSKRYSLGEPVAMTFFRADRPGSRRK